MNSILSLFAVLVAMPVHAQTPPRNQTFLCEGRGTSNGYPYGVRDTGKALYRIIIDGRQITVFRVTETQENICGDGGDCPAVNTADTIELDATGKRGWDPGYSSHFRFHPKTLAFEAFAGGLDGGWSVAGTCKAEAVAKP